MTRKEPFTDEDTADWNPADGPPPNYAPPGWQPLPKSFRWKAVGVGALIGLPFAFWTDSGFVLSWFVFVGWIVGLVLTAPRHKFTGRSGGGIPGGGHF